jgi:predicted nucleotide-binding protein
MPYHIVIKAKSAPWDEEPKVDLTRSQLEARYLRPYQEGRPIVTGGKTIGVGDLEYMRIYSTNRCHKSLLALVRKERETETIRIAVSDVEYMLMKKAKDVTDHFITQPPGKLERSRDQAHKPAVPDSRAVFVVHGRDEKAKRALVAFLRSIDLRPLEWSEAVEATRKPTPYVGEVLDKAFSMARAVVVLMTPDDEARLREELRRRGDPEYEAKLTPQARANVLFEAGMAMAAHRDRTVIVELGSLRPFTDISGLHVIRLNNTLRRRQQLASRLKVCGCRVRLTGPDWPGAGDFTR